MSDDNFPTDEEIRTLCLERLRSFDLSVLTLKALRSNLEETLGHDLKSKKDLLSSTLNEYMVEKQNECLDHMDGADEAEGDIGQFIIN